MMDSLVNNLSDILNPEEIHEVLKDRQMQEIVNNYSAVMQDDGISHPTNAGFNNDYQYHPDNQVYNNVHIKTEHPTTPIIPTVVSIEDYSGPYNFDVYVNPPQRNEKWEYSSILRKIFIHVRHPFPIDFKWEQNEMNLFVKATPLYCLPQFSQELVTTCIPHSMGNDSANKYSSPRIWKHIMRCKNANAMYEGGIEEGKHLSVTIPLDKPQTGSEIVREIYHFVCKNSCASGMNRKAIYVVFTLENDQGNILGRRCIEVRICSCPKRDKEKEEKDFLLKGEVPQGKKRKLSKKSSAQESHHQDAGTYNVNFSSIYGKENAKAIKKYAFDLISGEINRNEGNEHVPHLKKCLNGIKEMMNKPL